VVIKIAIAHWQSLLPEDGRCRIHGIIFIFCKTVSREACYKAAVITLVEMDLGGKKIDNFFRIGLHLQLLE
jgi:hypothetical protein